MSSPSRLPDLAMEALGNAERRRLLVRLADGPQSVAELAAGFEISRPAISRHLRVLQDAHLVLHRPDGARNVYSLDRLGIESTVSWLTSFWDDAEARLQLLARNLTDPVDE